VGVPLAKPRVGLSAATLDLPTRLVKTFGAMLITEGD